MAFKPPLSTAELRAIQDRNPTSSDVRALLWEVKRLRAVALRADQLQRCLPNTGGSVGAILTCLRSELANEPVIVEKKDPPPEDEPIERY